MSLKTSRTFLADLKASQSRGEELNLTHVLNNVQNTKSRLEKKSERLQQLQDSLDECYKKKRQTKLLSKESERLKTDCISTRKKTTEVQSQPTSDEERKKVQTYMFKEYCGLEFKTTAENVITMIFTNIDDTDHKREFTVTLSLDDDYKWTLISAQPEIQGIAELVDQLNVDNDLHPFCRELRQHYLRICNKEQQQRLKIHPKIQKNDT